MEVALSVPEFVQNWAPNQAFYPQKYNFIKTLIVETERRYYLHVGLQVSSKAIPSLFWIPHLPFERLGGKVHYFRQRPSSVDPVYWFGWQQPPMHEIRSDESGRGLCTLLSVRSLRFLPKRLNDHKKNDLFGVEKHWRVRMCFSRPASATCRHFKQPMVTT